MLVPFLVELCLLVTQLSAAKPSIKCFMCEGIECEKEKPKTYCTGELCYVAQHPLPPPYGRETPLVSGCMTENIKKFTGETVQFFKDSNELSMFVCDSNLCNTYEAVKKSHTSTEVQKLPSEVLYECQCNTQSDGCKENTCRGRWCVTYTKVADEKEERVHKLLHEKNYAAIWRDKENNFDYIRSCSNTTVGIEDVDELCIYPPVAEGLLKFGFLELSDYMACYCRSHKCNSEKDNYKVEGISEQYIGHIMTQLKRIHSARDDEIRDPTIVDELRHMLELLPRMNSLDKDAPAVSFGRKIDLGPFQEMYAWAPYVFLGENRLKYDEAYNDIEFFCVEGPDFEINTTIEYAKMDKFVEQPQGDQRRIGSGERNSAEGTGGRSRTTQRQTRPSAGKGEEVESGGNNGAIIAVFVVLIVLVLVAGLTWKFELHKKLLQARYQSVG